MYYKVFGHIYASTKEDFNLLKASLENDGYEVAMDGENSATIFKAVPAEETEDAES